jgi:hypothetical protein
VNGNTVVANFDFIPAEGTPAYLTDKTIVGEIAKPKFGGLPIIGSYGPMLVSESSFWPAGYIACVATGGPSSPDNCLGFREHVAPEWRGLKLIPGNRPRFPLVDSFYVRGFGLGARHRGAAAVSQITASGTYAIPAAYL